MNNKEIIFMFSGQGSQYCKMGFELYQRNDRFKYWLDKLDDVFIMKTRKSVINALFYNEVTKGDTFDEIFYSHPAIFMIQYSLAMTLIDMGIKPKHIIGASLGEYVSVAVAGVISYETAIDALTTQVEILKDVCNEGSMIAILDNEKVFHENSWLYEVSDLIAVNNDKHIVIACKKVETAYIQNQLKKKEIVHALLPVHYAFHSNEIERLYDKYSEYLVGLTYNSPKYNVISSVSAMSEETISDSHLWDVLRQPIKFREVIEKMEKINSFIYIDIGPAGTLENFVNSLLHKKSESKVYSIITPYSSEVRKMDEVIKACKKNINLGKEVKRMKAYLFPGQGSQSVGMGKGLFDEFNEIVETADRILGYSIKELCLENKDGLLGITKYTQPALYVVNALHYMKEIKETGIYPDFLAGHSLGEYSALYSANVFDFETGLMIVKKRAEIMNKAVGGGMAAIIGLTEEEVNDIIIDNRLDQIDIANLNTPTQIVISGPKSRIDSIKAIFENNGARAYIVLNVSGAFHSRYMNESAKEFETYIKKFTYAEPTIPVISNYTARKYRVDEIVVNMVEQMMNSVKWSESICYLMGKNITEMKQIGPGNTIDGLVTRIKKEGTPLIEEVYTPVVEELKVKEYTRVEEELEVEEEELCNSEEEIMTDTQDVVKRMISDTKVDFDSKEAYGETIGSDTFKDRYNLRYAYLVGSMNNGISSDELVIKVGKVGSMAFLGAKGMESKDVRNSIKHIKTSLDCNEAYGVNVSYNPMKMKNESQLIDLLLDLGIRTIEASSYLTITGSLVKYKIKGLSKNSKGKIISNNKIIAKVSRPDVASLFMSPIPERLIEKLLNEGEISSEEANIANGMLVADDICVEGDSAGNTDRGNLLSLLPSIIRLKGKMSLENEAVKNIHIGAAGGIGTPEAVAACFFIGADFILTGSINQCTVESRTSHEAKKILQHIDVHDTEHTPSLDMFELGCKSQVVKRGLFYPARANSLYEIYRSYNSLEAIETHLKEKLENKYFKKSISSILNECMGNASEEEQENIRDNPKNKMALVFKWYLNDSERQAQIGEENKRVNYSIKCSSALGAFNQWVKGSDVEMWRDRNVDKITMMMMDGAAVIMRK